MRKLKNEELERKTIEEFKHSDKTPIVVVLDNVRSLNNIGSVFRTADAFLIEAVYLCGITATPPHKDIHKTALGATDSVAWKYFPDTLSAIENLKKENHKIYAIEQTEKSIFLNNFSPNKNEKIALIFGNEINGVAQNAIEQCDASIEIPQLGTKHSLNIAVSVGVVVWDIFSKMK